MADEIPGQNVIRVVLGRLHWWAFIGPDMARGVKAYGPTPIAAIEYLAAKLELAGYVFDASWQPRD